jgi:hypothetical protein
LLRQILPALKLVTKHENRPWKTQKVYIFRTSSVIDLLQGKAHIMRSKTLISTIALAGILATSMSCSAYADGGRHGGHGGNNGIAIAAGVLGALAIGSIIANANAAPAYPAPQPYYQPPAQTYYEAPQQYYQPAPPPQVVYQPAPVYYPAQPAAVYIEGGYGRHHWREHRPGYYGY